jgi:uncharacterized RDD family membrane protein YckC
MEQHPLLPQAGITSGAGFWIRFLARLIDVVLGFVLGLITGIVAGIVLGILQVAGVVAPGAVHRAQGLSATGFGLSLLGGFLYHSVTEGVHGASLGKLLCKLRVVTADGLPCNMPRALLRSLAYYLDALFFGLVGYNSMQKSALKQRYGDVWAKTVVVRTTDVPDGAKRSIGRFFVGFCLGSACWIFMLALGLILKAK